MGNISRIFLFDNFGLDLEAVWWFGNVFFYNAGKFKLLVLYNKSEFKFQICLFAFPEMYFFAILCVLEVTRELTKEVKEKVESSNTEVKEMIESSTTEVKEKIESSTKKVKTKNESSIKELREKIDSSTREVKEKIKSSTKKVNESSTKELKKEIESSTKEIKEQNEFFYNKLHEKIESSIKEIIPSVMTQSSHRDRLRQPEERSTGVQKNNPVNHEEGIAGELDSVNYLFYLCDLW